MVRSFAIGYLLTYSSPSIQVNALVEGINCYAPVSVAVLAELFKLPAGDVILLIRLGAKYTD